MMAPPPPSSRGATPTKSIEEGLPSTIDANKAKENMDKAEEMKQIRIRKEMKERQIQKELEQKKRQMYAKNKEKYTGSNDRLSQYIKKSKVNSKRRISPIFRLLQNEDTSEEGRRLLQLEGDAYNHNKNIDQYEKMKEDNN